jgi:hypothetical protein
MERVIAVTQGLYFFVTGVWPLLDIESFQLVTGPKRDIWLVKTVGVLVAVIGAVLVLAGAGGEITSPILLLAVGSAAALATVDVNYVAKRVIPPIYLLDALLEVGFVFLMLAAVILF